MDLYGRLNGYGKDIAINSKKFQTEDAFRNFPEKHINALETLPNFQGNFVDGTPSDENGKLVAFNKNEQLEVYEGKFERKGALKIKFDDGKFEFKKSKVQKEDETYNWFKEI